MLNDENNLLTLTIRFMKVLYSGMDVAWNCFSPGSGGGGQS